MIEKKTIVEIEPRSKWGHISILLTGLKMLEKDGKIELIMRNNSHKSIFEYDSEPGMDIIILAF